MQDIRIRQEAAREFLRRLTKPKQLSVGIRVLSTLALIMIGADALTLPPSISAVEDVSISLNTNTGPINFTIGDFEMAASDLTLSATSSNTQVVPVVNIVFGGSGANRTVTVTPLTNLIGNSTIIITVSDGSLAASETFVLTVTEYAYLEDVDTSPLADGTPPVQSHPFPRVALEESGFSITTEALSKYRVSSAGPEKASQVASLKSAYPESVVLMFQTPLGNGGGGSMPFNSSGPTTTTSGQVYPGHWLYKAGSTTSQFLSSSETTVQVDDAVPFIVGEYAVIYDPPLGGFVNAEHVEITVKSGNTLTLERGYNSTAVSHSSGSIIAPHILHPIASTTWRFNLASSCPTDGNGKKLSAAMVDYMNSIWDSNYDGWLFDTDSDTEEADVDTDNDGVAEGGITTSGDHLWIDGWEEFYSLVRAAYPGKLVVAGTISARGFPSVNGTQAEGFPVSGDFFQYPPDYPDLDSKLDAYLYHLHHTASGIGPSYTSALSKSPTMLMPGEENPPPTTNAPFRLSFGLALMGDGYYAMWRGYVFPYEDPWWDEYAVNITTGVAVPSNPADESQVRQHGGWLGMPKGPRYRVYDPSLFEASDSLVSNGDFETDLTDWISTNTTISRVTGDGNFMEGNAGLHASTQIVYDPSASATTVQGSSVSLSANTEYTLAFSIKSSALRKFNVSWGGNTQSFYAGAEWKRKVFTVKTGGSALNSRPTFQIGNENTEIWIDAVYAFEGNADVFRRDFDNGIVVVNATPSARTVDLGGTFRRILGTQDPVVNNGAAVSMITIDPYDSAILLRTCLFCDEFDDGAPDTSWTYDKDISFWSEDGASLIGTNPNKKSTAVADPVFGGCTNCYVETVLSTAGGAYNKIWLLLHVQDPKTDLVELLGKEEQDKWVLKHRIGKTVVAKQNFQSVIDPNVFYTARIRYDGVNYIASIDGVDVITLAPGGPVTGGSVGFKVKKTVGTFQRIEVN